jgi:competence protein ComEC
LSEITLDLRKVPVVRALIPFAAGLMLHSLLPGSGVIWILVSIIGGVLVILILAPFFRLSRSGPVSIVYGLGTMLFFFLAGSACMRVSSLPAAAELDGMDGFVTGRVRDGPVEKERSWVIQIEAIRFDSDSVTCALRENIQVYIQKDSIIPQFTPGTLCLFMGELNAIRNRGNPGEFDYASYMQRRNYRYSLFCSSARCIDPHPAAKYLPARIRQGIISAWKREGQNHPAVAVLSAITLGYKSDLDRQTRRSFSDAGAMHLLAVSGLHVGMVWWILDLLLRFPRHTASWRTTKLVLILVILWFYAGITGFSDSVTRSVTMFSLVAFSKTLNRKSNIFNTLLLSAFLLLLLKPDRILEPGFQLSYLAVFGIITIQPKFSLFYKSCSKPVKWVLDLVSVSIAAQLGTLPLVLLYFHQFPVWFILTNLVAIPMVSILLAAFVLFSPFLILFPEYEHFSLLLLKLAVLLNSTIETISSLPGAVISDIFLHPFVAGSLMTAIISLVGLLIYHRFFILMTFLLMLTITGSISSYISYSTSEKQSFEVYNFNRATIISGLHGAERDTYIFSNDSTIDAYTGDFIRSLNRIPGPIREHKVFINGVSNHDGLNMGVSNPDGPVQNSPERLAKIGEALWSFKVCGLDVLVTGRCNRHDLMRLFEEHTWDVAVFRTGSPRFREEQPLLPEETIVVGDGTLRDFEVEFLRQSFPAAYLVTENGPFSYHFKTSRAPSLLDH